MSTESFSSSNEESQFIAQEVKSTEASTGQELGALANEVAEPHAGYAPEAKEQYEPTKVYEITNPADIGFGRSSLKTEHLSFAVNGPLVLDDGMPVGGYISGGRQLKDFIDPASAGGNFAVDNGIIGLGVDGKMHLVSYKDIKNTNILFKWAFQNGPMLVVDGKNTRGTSDTKWNRSGIGYRRDGSVVVIYSDKPVTFREFADLFVNEGCTNAMYLDGGPYSGYQDEKGPHGQLNGNATKLQFFHQKK